MKKLKNVWQRCHNDPMYFGALLFRIAFGLLFLFVGIKKLRMGYGGFAESIVNADDLLGNEIPDFLLYIYGYLMPALELLAGILLLIDRRVKTAYIIIGLIYLSLVFGQEYNGNTSKVGTEYLPSMVALWVGYYLHHRVAKRIEE